MIRDKVEQIQKTRKYNFCDIDFDIYDNDSILIYDKVDGNCIYCKKVKDQVSNDLLDKEQKKEELIKLKDNTYAICFYLDAPDKIEHPISMKANFI